VLQPKGTAFDVIGKIRLNE